jgi:hypothetical protein
MRRPLFTGIYIRLVLQTYFYQRVNYYTSQVLNNTGTTTLILKTGKRDRTYNRSTVVIN